MPSEPQQNVIGLDAQVTEFEIGYLFGAPSGSAAVIFIGGNDYHDVSGVLAAPYIRMSEQRD